MHRNRAPAFGAAISADSLAFFRIEDEARGRRSRPVDEEHRGTIPETFLVPLSNGDFADAIARAFREAAAALAGMEAQVDVALLPPLVDVRVLPVPKRTTQSVDAYLRQESARLFFSIREPVTVSVIEQSADRAGPIVLAAAVPTRVLEAVNTGARNAGLNVNSIVAAHGAWLKAAAQLLDDVGVRRSLATRVRWLGRLAPAHALMDVDIHVHLVQNMVAMPIRGGIALPVRRWPHGAEPSVSNDTALLPPGLRVVIGTQASADESAPKDTGATGAATDGMGVEAPVAAEPAAAVRTDPRSPSEVAARFARGAPLELVLDELQTRRDRASRRRAARSIAAALVIGTLAAAVHLWGLRKRLGEFRHQRDAIAAQVVPFRAQRDSLARLAERLAVLENTRSGGTGWTGLLFDLALRLPTDAWIHSVSTVGDTITLRASALRAGDAVQALSSSRVLRELHIDGAIERELLNDTAAIEHFTMVGRLMPPAES